MPGATDAKQPSNKSAVSTVGVAPVAADGINNDKKTADESGLAEEEMAKKQTAAAGGDSGKKATGEEKVVEEQTEAAAASAAASAAAAAAAAAAGGDSGKKATGEEKVVEEQTEAAAASAAASAAAAAGGDSGTKATGEERVVEEQTAAASAAAADGDAGSGDSSENPAVLHNENFDGDGENNEDFQHAEGGDDDAVMVAGNLCGLSMGSILSNIKDLGLRYDVDVGKNELVFEFVYNEQDNISKKSKKFFVLMPNFTPVLYGFANYHALLNTRSHRGWIGHCRLTSSKLGAEGVGYVLWEIWETRCVRPRIDGILIKEDGNVIKIMDLEKWLVANELNSDTKGEYDTDFYKS